MKSIAKKRKLLLRNVLMFMLLPFFFSCQEWGLWDDPAGNQKNPPTPDYTPKVLAEYTFEDGVQGTVHLYENGTQPETFADAERGGNIVHLKGSYLQFDNPLLGASLANGASVTFWVKMTENDTHGALFSFKDNDGNVVYYNGNSGLHYKKNGDYLWIHNPDEVITAALQANEWYFVAIAFGQTGFTIYINGDKKYDAANNLGISSSSDPFDYEKIVEFLHTAPYFYLGYGAETDTKEAYYDNVKVYANTITSKEATPEGIVITIPEPVYFNSFDVAHTATIVGGGSFVTSGLPGFDIVFQNAAGGTRQNYLLLPDDVLSHSTASKELTVGVWVNASNAGGSSSYTWAPLFTAYGAAPSGGANTWPMFALQYRGIAQVNCTGWCDFTDAQNVAGVNTLYHGDTDWLADSEWHYYTATFTSTSAKVYFDGELKNEWSVDGTSDGAVISGLFSNGADLKYICLGGNQAWDWADQDPGFMFDDIAIYNSALSQAQINEIIAAKRPTVPEPVYLNTFDVAHTATIVGGGSFVASGKTGFGTIFQNATGGTRQNYLLLPEDILSHSVDNKALSVGVWVNASNAGGSSSYMWAPLFTAYGSAPSGGENTWPMLALQYRGVAQVNCAGWCDFTDAQNVAGVNTLYHDDNDWLADGEWHYYTATFTETSAKVYFDGVLKNEWSVDGTSDGAVISGLFSNGADLKYICLGGNQAWSWADQDPGFMFDDIAIYNVELTPQNIATIISNK